MTEQNETKKYTWLEIRKQGIEVHFQPIYNIADKRITALEALFRACDGQGGYLNPEEVVRDIEAEGHSYALDCWVIDQTCAYMQEFRKRGIKRVNVNLSPASFHGRLRQGRIELPAAFGLRFRCPQGGQGIRLVYRGKGERQSSIKLCDRLRQGAEHDGNRRGRGNTDARGFPEAGGRDQPAGLSDLQTPRAKGLHGIFGEVPECGHP